MMRGNDEELSAQGTHVGLTLPRTQPLCNECDSFPLSFPLILSYPFLFLSFWGYELIVFLPFVHLRLT
jgi:hypothetical protein